MKHRYQKLCSDTLKPDKMLGNGGGLAFLSGGVTILLVTPFQLCRRNVQSTLTYIVIMPNYWEEENTSTVVSVLLLYALS